MVRLRATVAYDGSAFSGFAENPGVETVAGTIRSSVERILRVPTPITCAGRTDKGVHGRGQVIHFDAPDDVDVARLGRSLRKVCGPAIAVSGLEVAPDDFDARFSATSRTYRFRVLATPDPDPLRRNVVWHVYEPLDIALMQEAAQAVVGPHDFTTFCKKPKVADGEPEPSLRREVLSAAWHEAPDDELVLWISATAFCHQMVRSIVGTCVDIGRGALAAGCMGDLLAAADRDLVGTVAPPQGLTLWHVGY